MVAVPAGSIVVDIQCLERRLGRGLPEIETFLGHVVLNEGDQVGQGHGLVSASPRYRGHAPKIALCEDARRCLDRLGGRVRLGLITDGPDAMQRAKIAALGTAPRFALVRPTGAWGAEFSKPHPRAFIEMEETAAGAPLVYVADNALKDFVTPRARGWHTIQICREGRVHTAPPPDAAHAPHARIETLDTLEATLAAVGWPVSAAG